MDESGRIRRGQVDERGSRGGVGEVEREEDVSGGRAGTVDVLEDQVAGREACEHGGTEAAGCFGATYLCSSKM